MRKKKKKITKIKLQMNEREIYFRNFFKKKFQTCPELFYKKAVLKNFEIFIGKTPVPESLFYKAFLEKTIPEAVAGSCS